MSASHAPAIESPLSQLVEGFIKVLTNERGASSHTLRAYERELHGFASWAAKRGEAGLTVQSIEHTDIRAYLGTLYERSECCVSCVDAPPAKTSAARSLH